MLVYVPVLLAEMVAIAVPRQYDDEKVMAFIVSSEAWNALS